jgi:hypothetical protein
MPFVTNSTSRPRYSRTSRFIGPINRFPRRVPVIRRPDGYYTRGAMSVRVGGRRNLRPGTFSFDRDYYVVRN